MPLEESGEQQKAGLPGCLAAGLILGLSFPAGAPLPGPLAPEKGIPECWPNQG